MPIAMCRRVLFIWDNFWLRKKLRRIQRERDRRMPEAARIGAALAKRRKQHRRTSDLEKRLQDMTTEAITGRA